MGIASLLVFLPLAGIGILLFLPKNIAFIAKYISFAFASIQAILTGILVFQFNPYSSALQFATRTEWFRLELGSLGAISVDYFLGVDGITISFLVLSAIVFWVASISSFSIEKQPKLYHILFLLLCAAVPGCFLALDLFLFFVFFEFMLLPMFFLIGIWGGERREYASIKFFIYTLVGSVAILIVFILLGISSVDPLKTAEYAGISNPDPATTQTIVQQLIKDKALDPKNIVHGFNFLVLLQPENFLPDSILQSTSTLGDWNVVTWIALALFIGFLIKLPAFPFHTWLPDAHVEAPTAISVVLAGILLKIGTYGIIRFPMSLFPQSLPTLAPLLAWTGAISIVYGACNALVQKDLKKMVAYSSVSQMGYVLLGLATLNAEGIAGSIFHSFSHGIVASGLFLLVGVVYDRVHDRQIQHFSGLVSHVPKYSAVVMVTFFAGLGLPGLSGFIGEFFVLMGSYNSKAWPWYIALVASVGLVLSAAYFLWTYQRMFLGKFWTKGGQVWNESLVDLSLREWAMLAPLLFLIIVLGVYPKILIDLFNFQVNHWLDFILPLNTSIGTL